MNIPTAPLLSLIRMQKEKQISSSEILQELSRRRERLDPIIQAYLSVKKFSSSELPDIILPIAVKDNICTKDFPTTCASKILKDFHPYYDATAVALLREAGGVVVGKTNLDEFGMGSSTENSGFFPTKNPWALERVPGGSSGGSAAAVASGMVPVALGTDTGGSVRQPASFCALFGIRPTYGLVSRFGLVAFASSLDQIGVLARTVEDTAYLLSLIARYDPRDSTSRYSPPLSLQHISEKRNFRIGWIRELADIPEMDSEVGANLQETLKILEQMGHTLQPVSIPLMPYSLDVYYVIAPAEASSNLARYDGILFGLRIPAEDWNTLAIQTRSFGFGNEVKRRILLGNFVLRSGYYQAYYQKALSLRKALTRQILSALQEVDVLISPTSPILPFRFGERYEQPLKMYFSDIDTIPPALAGIPALSFPSGFSAHYLPIGMQLWGKPFDEVTLFQLAFQFQEETGYKNLLAPLSEI
ncbi:MAG: Asp-tRNA(Asn)/Glu-tRNA(Gln) amidotransferase subunit GatA [bacterium]